MISQLFEDIYNVSRIRERITKRIDRHVHTHDTVLQVHTTARMRAFEKYDINIIHKLVRN